MTDGRAHGLAVEVLGTGTPSGQVQGLAVETMGAVPADGRVHGLVVEVLGVNVNAPGAPQSFTATPHVFSIDTSWLPPITGGPVVGYQVQLDSGAIVEASVVTSWRFAPLLASTSYTMKVRAYNNGGPGPWATVVASTFAADATPPGYYRVEVQLGSHTWSASTVDAAGYGVRLPLSLGWQLSDQVEWFPAQSDPLALSFQLYLPDVSVLEDVVRGTTVVMDMYVQVDEDADPWQTFRGIVTQLDATTVNDGAAVLVTVYAGDDNMRLADMTVGYSGDWPQEDIYARVNRICAEAGITPEWFRSNGGLEGILGARSSGPISVLDALRSSLKDAASDNVSEYPAEYYGRYVFMYSGPDGTDYLDPNTLRITPFERRVYGGTTVQLDGCYVDASKPAWSKLPGRSAPTWAIVDHAVFGTPDGTAPLVRNTSLVYVIDPDTGTNWSTFTLDNLGESLLPDGSTQLDGWYARQLVYVPHRLDPPVSTLEDILLVTGWASYAPMVMVQPVVITDVDPRYQLAGETYLAGTLTGARLVIPPGGVFYLELRLRPELLPGTELP